MKLIIKIEELLQSVKVFEQEVLKSSFIGRLDEQLPIYLFHGQRRNKFVIVTLHQMPWMNVGKWQEVIFKELLAHPDYSETVDFFCYADMSFNKQSEIQTNAQSGFQLNFNIYDGSRLRSIPSFSFLFDNGDDDMEQDDSRMSRMLFEYLSLSQRSQDIKDGLFHSLILFEIFENKRISLDGLAKTLSEKFGSPQEGVEVGVNYLKQKNKIVSPKGNKALLELSEEEESRIEESQKEANEIEKDFMSQFNEIMGKYGIEDTANLLNLLTQVVASNYDWDVDDANVFRDSAVGRGESAFDSFRNAIESLLNHDAERCLSLVEELNVLCARSPYLDKMCAGKAFINLYRSNNYEEYVNAKKNIIVIDTPVFANYICLKSSFSSDYELWNDHDFQTVSSLVNLVEKSAGKTIFCVPYDYVNETVGELMKALRLSWFEQFQNMPVPIQTANVFFNFYLYIKSEKENQAEDVSCFTFVDFLKEFGFPNTDSDDLRFRSDTASYLTDFANTLGCRAMPMIDSKYELFDKVKNDYIWSLNELSKSKKTEMAVNHDVRQAFFLTEESRDDEDEDYYVCTWDGSIRVLRDILKKEYDLKRSYAVCRPAVLVNRISLKRFHINNECLTNELVAYADRNYGISSKVQHLFDDILSPFFSSLGKKNSTLVNAILKMSKSDVDSAHEGKSFTRSNRLPFENIFNAILDALSIYQCSPQNLRDFIEDSKNERYIASTLKKAYEQYKVDGVMPQNIIADFCIHVQQFVDLGDEEVKMG